MNRLRVGTCLLATLLLSGCSAGTGTLAAASGSGRTHRRVSSAATRPRARLQGPARHHSLRRPVVVTASGGTIGTVVLRGGGTTVQGHRTAHGRAWRSTGRLLPETRYRATVELASRTGGRRTTTLRVRTGRPARTLSMTATPGPGWTEGVGEPIAVTFNAPVPDKAAVQHSMHVTTDQGPVRGAWHWFSATVAHYRPRHFWPADTTVHVHIDLHDVDAGHGLWGDRNHDWSWHTGARHVSYVDAARHTFTVTDGGRTIHTWPTGTGMPGFSTRDGIYTVLDKSPQVQMTSCSVGLSCSPGSPSYYDLTVHWDTRLTDTGTFIHAAPWDSQLGRANTSHGCIHLSDADAMAFYQLTRPGDVVIVRGTGRAPDLTTDPGMMDWNMSWARWKAGSALAH